MSFQAADHIATALIAVAALPLNCFAQPCEPSWISGFGLPGTSAFAEALAVFDFGDGPRLVGGGNFSAAGGLDAHFIAEWDGVEWSPSPMDAPFAPKELAGFDLGKGPEFYVAGLTFPAARAQCLYRWTDSTWGPLGSGLGPYEPTDHTAVYALEAHDDGRGRALFVGGFFATAGGLLVNDIARWDGENWSAVGGGFSVANGLFHALYALAVFDDGNGPSLYAGGEFTEAGGRPARHVAKWDGSSWTEVGGGINGYVNRFVVFDDGRGPALYAGGSFAEAGGHPARGIARWDGRSWTGLGPGLNGIVRALAVCDYGLGPTLYAGGDFTSSGTSTMPHIAAWNGSRWSTLETGTSSSVFDLKTFDDGNGAALYACGDFMLAGGRQVRRIARWNGCTWEALGQGMSNSVAALKVMHEGATPRLFAGGSFQYAGGTSAGFIARWGGTRWHALGSGLNSNVRALTEFTDGSGTWVVAGGDFTSAGGQSANRVARWNGSNWSAFGSGISGGTTPQVYALHAFDDGSGPALYAGGSFTTAGGLPASNVAKWNGTQWTALGSGTDARVQAFATYDDGTGSALYVAGDFGHAGGLWATGIAKWDGRAWSALASSLAQTLVHALLTFDFGTGPALYAGGDLFSPGSIAKWNGRVWSPLGIGMNGRVSALTGFDDGSGRKLYVGGDFTSAGGVPVRNVARWNGSAWENIGFVGALSTASSVDALAGFDDGSGPALYAGGDFETIFFSPAASIVRRGCAELPHSIICTLDLSGDGLINTIDLGILLSSWSIPSSASGCSGAPACSADLNQDGFVNALDLGILLASWTL